jgi:hypothetical protein
MHQDLHQHKRRAGLRGSLPSDEVKMKLENSFVFTVSNRRNSRDSLTFTSFPDEVNVELVVSQGEIYEKELLVCA